MPYLHWETDKNREAFWRIVRTENAKYLAQVKKRAEHDHRQRQAARSGLPRSSQAGIPHLTGRRMPHSVPTPPVLMPTWSNVIGKVRPLTLNMSWGITMEQSGRVKTSSALGKFFLDAARLYTVMVAFRDRKMMEEYLFHDLPLHPRRTLDQSYNWAIETSRQRDRDQVVFRATKYRPENEHRLLGPIKQTTKSDYYWKSHWSGSGWLRDGYTGYKESHGCSTSRAATQQTPRVVMSDQLWMWVLDRDTLLTFFPKRYGVDEFDDPSGVDSAIRRALEQTTGLHLQSIFDLALIVLEESSMSLLNRGGTTDGKPDVFRVFKEAISRLVSLLIFNSPRFCCYQMIMSAYSSVALFRRITR
ncbi:hypothetical protein VTI74DRAFT_6671 [Chaetomium olivicolor]